jgi:zinc/manganese transport system substrate-binding protein
MPAVPMTRRALLLLSFFLALPAAAAPLRVVASFSILGDWASVVGGNDVALTVLAGPECDPHAYEPSPADARAVASAQVLAEIGAGFEPWLPKILQASGAAPRLVRVTDAVPLRRNGAEADPHVWGDPANAVRAVEALRDAFADADPAHAGGYRRRVAEYINQLRALDASIQSRVAAVPAARRTLITAHDTLGYWADRYGFRVEATILDSFSTEAADPSAANLARLADRLKALRAPAVFVETARSGDLARSLARGAGARETPRLYTDALGSPRGPAATYIALMNYNADAIVQALSAPGGKP